MLNDADEGILQLWAELEDKLVGGFHREARRYEADVESPAERREHVDCPPLIKPEDGIDTLGELRADCRSRGKGREGTKSRRFLSNVIKINLFPDVSCGLPLD